MLTPILLGLSLGLRHGIDVDHIAALGDICGTSDAPRKKMIGALAYIIGHALVVAVLGVVAILSARLLPDWVDGLMERAIGVTLIVLGLYLFATLFKQSSTHGPLRLPLRNLSPRATFGVGIIHGVGAETATQVMLLAGLGSVQAHDPQVLAIAIGTLIAFIGGLMIANTAIALACTSLVNLTDRTGLRPAYVACGAVAAGFSIFTGIKYLM